jgi:hypothetical protein
LRQRLDHEYCVPIIRKSRAKTNYRTSQYPELHIANPASQTRMVSGGQLQPQQQELSQDLKYMARGRISEFESSHPSHVSWNIGQAAGEKRAALERWCYQRINRWFPL